VYDTRRQDVRLGVLAFRDAEVTHKERKQQVDLLLKAYDKACDRINKQGVRHYRQLIIEKCGIKPQVADSLPAGLKFSHIQAPREQDIAVAEQWVKKGKKVDVKGKKEEKRRKK
jgi:NitT/TauT family transport system substrate-binding protein